MSKDSSSPPGPGHSSPPVSLPPTPSPPENNHDRPPSHSLLRSRSSGRSASPPSLTARMGGRSSDNEKITTAAQRQLRPGVAPAASAPAGKLPRLPLQDSSQYSESYVPVAAITTSSTSLAELAHLIRLQGYQEQRRFQSRVRLHRWLVASALSARLARCGELAHKTLVDNFRSDDKKNFATLYNALHDVRNSCDCTRRYALLEPDLQAPRTSRPRSDTPRNVSTFMTTLPSHIREDLLDFVCKIRNDPEFLAGRISSLSTVEMTSLTAFHTSLDPIESVMPLPSRGRAIPSNANRQSAHVPTPVERLLSFQRHDPLSALLYTIFANSSGPDSAEDLRRTDIWSSMCARLITESKSGSEQFMCTVLNTWASMREWPAKGNLELYLMRMLQDGAFLLEKSEDALPGTRTQAEPRSAKDSIAAEDFYDKAVKGLFEVIDDEPSAGGIPEGVLELGLAIMRKLEDPKKQKIVQTFIVSKWLFSVFLMNAVIHPESHGMMTGHHITEYARQKILKEIAVRSQKQVLDSTYNWKQAAPPPPEIKTHIDNILGRFRHLRSKNTNPILLPAKAITSPRETVEVQPFLVICPSDIVTLFNTLFPEKRPPSSSMERDVLRNGLVSSASSVSNLSVPIRAQPTPRGGFDGNSLLSNSGSSITSEMTSREPLLDNSDPNTPMSSRTDLKDAPKFVSIEDYGLRLRKSIAEMTRVLGLETSAGSCHPCAENWAVLYVSQDGKSLMPRMRKDFDEEEEDDEDSPDSDSDDEETPAEKSELEREYHQLKEAIIKLVEEYEIPKELAPDSESKEFSNRTSSHRKDVRKFVNSRSEIMISGDKGPSKNPYQSQLTAMLTNQKQAVAERSRSMHGRSSSLKDAKEGVQEPTPVLLTMLEAAMNQCQARSDFVAAHLYWKTLHQLIRLSTSANSLSRNGYAPLLNYFSRGPRDSLGKSASAIEEFEAWFVWLKQSQERHDAAIEEMMHTVKDLRDKMWYVTDVKNSAIYEETKNLAVALKTMGQPVKPDSKPASKSRPTSRSAANNFLLRSEDQLIDILAAAYEQGGPNKLSDEQADMTLRWLTKFDIENAFCKGEERIHRFCLEMDKCVEKLVGQNILDGPVLWSSELYQRDSRILDSGRQKGDLFLTGVGTLSIAGDEEYEIETQKIGTIAPDSLSRSPRDLRSVSDRNGSQHSFDSGRHSGYKFGSVDIMDSQDYFGTSSPVLSIDSSATFWSPFQSQAQPPSSTSSIRPRTASSTNDTVMLKNSESVNLEKYKFLLDLKQSLTGLLLSDLGTQLWSRGSETDDWFSGDLGEECLQKKEEEERKRKRALARKKSKKMLRASGGSVPLEALGRTERSQPATPIATLEHAATDSSHSTEGNSTSSDATARSAGMTAAKKAGLMDFPYNIAFRRLLRKFSTHPNPFSKLHALYELELLITASLASRMGRSFGSRRDTIPITPASPSLASMGEFGSRESAVHRARAKNLKEAIVNCENRRSHILASHRTASPLRSPSISHSSNSGPPTTDMIVEVLQSLFRDSEIRPKTLFRDLQFIASFIPAQILDTTDLGAAFWDAGLAALGLKQDICGTLVEMADEVVAYHTEKRNPHQNSSSQSPADDSIDDELGRRFSLEDAARMYIITAKEGDPVAQRELATFYLTHPDLLPRTTLPLTMPKSTFKAEMVSRRNEDPTRSDPYTMCVAVHWMELSDQGGDKLAKKYLRSRAELNSIP